MERRVLLAISLSFLVLFVYQTWIAPTPPTERPPETSLVPPSGNASAPPVSVAGIPGPGTLEAGRPAAPVPAVAALVGDAEQRDITIETEKVRAVFTNRGARLRHWWLKDYKNGAGQPLDLIPENIQAPLPTPFSLRVDDPATTARLNEGLYRHSMSSGAEAIEGPASGTSATPVDAAAHKKTTITFDLETADGLRVQKTFALAQDTYVVEFSATVQQGGQALNPTVDWGPGLGDDIARMPAGSFFSPNYIYGPQAIFQTTDGDVERIAATSIPTGMVRDGQFRWAGIDDHYFVSAVVQPPSAVHLEYAPVAMPSSSNPPVVGRYMSYSVRFASAPQGVKFFFGPKQLDVLSAVDPELTRAIYFGMFALLAVPLLGGLKWVHGFVGNWGWAIIVLTILINLAMFPLRHKSVVSMRKMQELQPQMKAIQDRYAKYKLTDPERQKMNQEVMELYKARGVNPAAGCVPMLLTMPFLFAFYAMLSQAIEIRGAEFGGWIHDLAAADPWLLTPILMGLSMIWQTKIQPSTADPTQQKIMMFMPFMFTFIFLGQPAGLAIYWLVSNLFNIGQQYFTNYLIGPPKVHNVRPSDDSKVAKAPKEKKK